MVTKVIKEKFTLTLNESGIVSTDRLYGADNDAESLRSFHEYPVPVGYSLVFTAEDTYSLYLYEDRGAEMVAQALVAIAIVDSSKQNYRSLLNPLRYAQVKEFQDVDKKCHLDIPVGQQVIAKEGERILILGTAPSLNITALSSYFQLTCERVRKTLFE